MTKSKGERKQFTVRWAPEAVLLMDRRRGQISRDDYLQAFVLADVDNLNQVPESGTRLDEPVTPVMDFTPTDEELADQEELTTAPDADVLIPSATPGAHWHRRVKTGSHYVAGRDVGTWACKECGQELAY